MGKTITFILTGLLFITTSARAQLPTKRSPLPFKAEKTLKQDHVTTASKLAKMKRDYPLLFKP